MTIDTKRLRELAEAATPGPWREGSVETYNVFVECRDPECLGTERVLLKMNTHFDHRTDAAFIAAANPQTVLALIDETERLRHLDQGFKELGIYDRYSVLGPGAYAHTLKRNQELEQQLAAMTAARDEACDIAQQSTYAIHFEDERRNRHARIASLRKVGR